MINININKKLNENNNLILDIDLCINEGDFVAINGKSGSGKTSLLRIIAGLDKSNGSIKINNVYWQNDKFFLPVQKRNIGFVFQDYALFPNMNVYENLLYVNKNKDLANRLLDITQLSDMKKIKVTNLSGGQKQRVSLCRAMMNNPKILLMDEPLSALDLKMRSKLQEELLILHKEFKMTVIMVSHDINEIKKLASRVIIIDNGKVIKDGLPSDMFFQKNNEKKFNFEVKVLDIYKQNNINFAKVLLSSQVIDIKIQEEDINNIFIGKLINIQVDNFPCKIV